MLKPNVMPRYQRRGRKRKRGMPRTLQNPYPASARVKLNYNANFNLTAPDAANAALYSFYWNGLNVPDNDANFITPGALGAWNIFYNRYCVVGAKAVVKFTCQTSGTSICNVGLFTARVPYTSVPTNTDLARLQEVSGGAHTVLQTAINGNIAKLVQTWSMKKWFSLENARDNLNTFGANVATNPALTEAAHLILWVRQPADAVPESITCTVDITYIVQFWERNLILT